MDKYITDSEEDTFALGARLGGKWQPGTVVALTGDLGCGKTAFVRGVVSVFGDAEEVSSPTFTLVNEYSGEPPIYHFDVYRLENAAPEQCDWMDEYFFGDGICLIEWAENIKSVLPEDTVWIKFEKKPEAGENCREITCC